MHALNSNPASTTRQASCLGFPIDERVMVLRSPLGPQGLIKVKLSTVRSTGPPEGKAWGNHRQGLSYPRSTAPLPPETC